MKPSGYDIQRILFAPGVAAGKEQIVIWTLTYHAFGERQEQKGECLLIIKRIQQTTDFDSMFED
jgi:hypothetical protein